MSQTPNPVSDYELHAYVDDELNERRRVEVEAWLATDPQAMAKVRHYRSVRERLHTRFDPILNEPHSLVVTERAPRMPWAYAAVMAIMMLTSGLLGWTLRALDLDAAQPALAQLVQPAAFAHHVYATDSRHPVEIGAGEQASLNHWIARRMHTDLRAPDLSSVGLSYIGGRLLPSTDRMAAQFMYEDKPGNRVTVYVRRIADAGTVTDFRYRERDGMHVFYWVDNSMGYAVIGTQDAARLIGFANAVQTAFQRQGTVP